MSLYNFLELRSWMKNQTAMDRSSEMLKDEEKWTLDKVEEMGNGEGEEGGGGEGRGEGRGGEGGGEGGGGGGGGGGGEVDCRSWRLIGPVL